MRKAYFLADCERRAGREGPVTLAPETRKDIDRLLEEDGIAGRIGQEVGE